MQKIWETMELKGLSKGSHTQHVQIRISAFFLGTVLFICGPFQVFCFSLTGSFIYAVTQVRESWQSSSAPLLLKAHVQSITKSGWCSLVNLSQIHHHLHQHHSSSRHHLRLPGVPQEPPNWSICIHTGSLQSVLHRTASMHFKIPPNWSCDFSP